MGTAISCTKCSQVAGLIHAHKHMHTCKHTIFLFLLSIFKVALGPPTKKATQQCNLPSPLHHTHPSSQPSCPFIHQPPTHPLTCSFSFHLFTGLSILDLTSIDNDVLSLQNVFKSWLHDCGTDSEHLHLVLPPTHTYSGELMVTLKCDLQERVLDPSSIPVLGQYFVRFRLFVLFILCVCNMVYPHSEN